MGRRRTSCCNVGGKPRDQLTARSLATVGSISSRFGNPVVPPFNVRGVRGDEERGLTKRLQIGPMGVANRPFWKMCWHVVI